MTVPISLLTLACGLLLTAIGITFIRRAPSEVMHSIVPALGGLAGILMWGAVAIYLGITGMVAAIVTLLTFFAVGTLITTELSWRREFGESLLFEQE